ncbi:sigma-70 family RNA polymerase sigma factor [Streptomyces sp. NPDC005485]|uniref:sigma-70 family RNA polymerase sigma factor n=1 Tax=Streptomyces sp. NPDC005485 TaxID=3155591 RepID=UPI0033B805E2
MADDVCRVCGKPLPARVGRAGRSSVYCSAACRQKAYRERQAPEEPASVRGLIEDIGRQVQQLVPTPPSVLYAGAADLASSVGRLRRVARVARDTARQTEPARDSVTPEPVTQSPLGDSEGDFAALVESYRRELRVHCYRITGSYDDSEDLVQETCLRAWRARDTFEGRAGARTWLYRIATNACLDFQRRTARRPQRYEPVPGMNHGTGEAPARVTWLQPYPDDELPTAEEDRPDVAAVSRETLELVFLAALQHLPPRQRAVLILRDVLGLSAAETAEALELTVASANSALQRARPTLRDHLPRERADWSAGEPTEAQRAVLQRYMAAAEQLDFAAMTDLLSKDVTLTMPPNPFWFTGRDALAEFLRPTLDPASPMFFGHWRHLPARANGQLAAGGYVRRPGTNVYRAQVLDVLRFGEDDRVVEITSFEPHLFPAFGLPLRL